MSRAPILVAGLGNPLMGDEGVGVCVIAALAPRAAEFPTVEFVDLGTPGLGLVHALRERRRAVLVDCARMGTPAGTARRFTPDEVRTTKPLTGLDAHEGDVLKLVALARQLGEAPDDLVIIGIEPASVGPGDCLSPALAARLPQYVALVLAELAR